MLATNSKKYNSSIANEPDQEVIEAFRSLYHSKEFKIFEIKIKELLKFYPFSLSLMNVFSSFLIEQKRYLEAISYLEKIIKIEPSNYRSTLDLAICSSKVENFDRSLKYYNYLIKNNYKKDVVLDQVDILLQKLNHKDIIKNKFLIKNILNFVINENKTNIPDFWRTFNIIFSKNELNVLTRDSQDLLFNPKINKLLSDDLFLNCLKSFIFKDSEIEKSLIKIRSEFLLLASLNKDIPHKKFIFSLSHQCFLNEYCYFISQDEYKILDKLISEIDFKNINEVNLSLLACYMPLNKILDEIEILNKFSAKNSDFSDLINLQIKEKIVEKKLEKNLIKLGEIQNSVSIKVKNHYEENPYPRWSVSLLPQKCSFIEEVINNDLQNKTLENNLYSETSELLIARCGTGKQVVDATRYGNLKITAVDLSVSSLTYGMRKCNEFGINNVQFIHSDILNLIDLNKKFDVIECSGVIHHMDNPNDGLKVLKKILKPGGYLKLGVYSELARKFIVEMKEYIKAKKYTDTAKDLRIFRNDVFNFEDNNIEKNIVSKLFLSDCFWNLSGVRDLVFHKQEYRYCIDDLIEMFKLFNFQFLGFVIQKDILDYYEEKFPYDKNKTELKNWDKFERNHPEIFSGMYQFWLKNDFS